MTNVNQEQEQTTSVFEADPFENGVYAKEVGALIIGAETESQQERAHSD